MSFSLFNSDNDLLFPAFCKPYPDELLSSWVARLSFDHGLRIPAFHKLSLSKKTEHLTDIDRTVTNDQIKLLALHTNCSFDEVKNTTLSYYINRLYEPVNQLPISDKWVLPRYQLSTAPPKVFYNSGLLYCPGCLSRPGQESYYKKEWRLSISFVCLDCGCYLIDKCPHCRKGISYINDPFTPGNCKIRDHMVTCEYCLQDMTKCEIEAAPASLIHIQKGLNTFLEKGFNDQGQPSETYFRALYHIANFILKGGQRKRNRMRSVIKDVYNVYNVYLNTHKITKLFRDMPLKKRADIIVAAHSLLEEWPATFFDMCKEYSLKSSDILIGFEDAPDWFRDPIIADSYQPSYARPLFKQSAKECTVMMKTNCFTRKEDYYGYDYDDYHKTGSY